MVLYAGVSAPALALLAAAAATTATAQQDVVGSFLRGLPSAPSPVSLRLCPLVMLPAHKPAVYNVTGTWTYNWGDRYNYTIAERSNGSFLVTLASIHPIHGSTGKARSTYRSENQPHRCDTARNTPGSILGSGKTYSKGRWTFALRWQRTILCVCTKTKTVDSTPLCTC
jgi:hypothetical protein